MSEDQFKYICWDEQKVISSANLDSEASNKSDMELSRKKTMVQEQFEKKHPCGEVG